MAVADGTAGALAEGAGGCSHSKTAGQAAPELKPWQLAMRSTIHLEYNSSGWSNKLTISLCQHGWAGAAVYDWQRNTFNWAFVTAGHRQECTQVCVSHWMNNL